MYNMNMNACNDIFPLNFFFTFSELAASLTPKSAEPGSVRFNDTANNRIIYESVWLLAVKAPHSNFLCSIVTWFSCLILNLLHKCFMRNKIHSPLLKGFKDTFVQVHFGEKQWM